MTDLSEASPYPIKKSLQGPHFQQRFMEFTAQAGGQNLKDPLPTSVVVQEIVHLLTIKGLTEQVMFLAAVIFAILS